MEALDRDAEQAPARLIQQARFLRLRDIILWVVTWAVLTGLLILVIQWRDPNRADYGFLAFLGFVLSLIVPLGAEDDFIGVADKALYWATPLSESNLCLKYEQLALKHPEQPLVPKGRVLFVADYLYAKERIGGFASQDEAGEQRAACARLHSKAP